MSGFSKQDYELINLGVCIKNQADRLGIEHEGVPLEGVVVRIAERALAVTPETEVDDEPCSAELWSLDYFRHQQVDAYWMRCHKVGAHDEHENSETGAHWPVDAGRED